MPKFIISIGQNDLSYFLSIFYIFFSTVNILINGKLKFKINHLAARNAGLKVSAELLRLAENVIDKESK